MTWWAQGKSTKHGYLIPSETRWFAKLAIAIALHEVDEAVLDRQRAEWVEDLGLMLRAQVPPSPVSTGIALPDGMRVVADRPGG